MTPSRAWCKPVHIDHLEVHSFPVPFKTVFRHASASRSRAENLIVTARSDDGLMGYGEGCPRSYVTGETVEGGAAFIRRHVPGIASEVSDAEGLRAWAEANRREIDENPAAFCAVELAVLDLFGKAAGAPVEDVLGVPRLDGPFTYSAVLGDSPYLVYRPAALALREQGVLGLQGEGLGRPGARPAEVAGVARRPRLGTTRAAGREQPVGLGG